MRLISFIDNDNICIGHLYNDNTVVNLSDTAGINDMITFIEKGYHTNQKTLDIISIKKSNIVYFNYC